MSLNKNSRLNHYLKNTPSENYTAPTIAYLAALDEIEKVSPEIARSILNELNDERKHLKLIASENFSSFPVQLAMGNLLTDKYAEGYPFHRFYAGCNNVDDIESLAQKEVINLFGCDHANVQPHSGATANNIAFWTILIQRIQNPAIEKLGKSSLDELSPQEHESIRQLLVNQKLMGMAIGSGGHLTHGFIQNNSSKLFQSVAYHVDPKTERLDYQALAKQVAHEKPTILLAGYSAHPCKINFAKMREIADSVGAVLLVDMAHFSGLVAGKVFTGEYDPVPYAHIITSTTHKTLRGPRGGIVLCKKEFADTLNKGCPLSIGGPLPHVMAAKAIAFIEANTPSFREYAHKIVDNAQHLAESFKNLGIPLVSGGTENHLLILNINSFGLTGRQVETKLREAGLTVNRNAVPNDQNGHWYTSGIRMGTPAVTTLNMGKPEMQEIAEITTLIIKNCQPATNAKTGEPSKAIGKVPEKIMEEARARVSALLDRFPLYPELNLDTAV